MAINFENTKVAFATKSDKELRKAERLFTLFNKPALVKWGGELTEIALKLRLPIKPLVKSIIYDYFCAGESIADSKEVFEKVSSNGLHLLINYAVEAKESEEEYNLAMEENLKAIRLCADEESVKVVCVKITGFGNFPLIEKYQKHKVLSESEFQEFKKVEERLHKLSQAAKTANVKLYIDAEESWVQVVLDKMAEKMIREFNTSKAVVYNTFQLYRHDKLAYLKHAIYQARNGGYVLGAKIVRGAYVDKENERARQMGYVSPIHKNKDAVDEDYKKAIQLCLDNLEVVSFCVASHNEESCAFLVEELDKRNIARNHKHVIVSQLYGMGDHISYNLAEAGLNATKYIPYGPVGEVIPYLIRRAKENSSVDGQLGRELRLIKKELERRK